MWHSECISEQCINGELVLVKILISSSIVLGYVRSLSGSLKKRVSIQNIPYGNCISSKTVYGYIKFC